MLTGGRHWLAHVPPHHHRPMPVVLLLHGAGGNSRNVMRQSLIARAADDRDVLVIAADGTAPRSDHPPKFFTNPQMWNDGSGRSTGPARTIDDVAFLCSLLDEVAQRYPVDGSRVYAMGFSNGGSMALRLAAELPDRIAAVAAGAGTPFAVPRPGVRPVPTICVIGSEDPIVPPAGGRVRLPWGSVLDQPSYQDRVRAWALAQGCAPEPALDTPARGVERRTWTGADGAEVVLYVIEGAGHVWPGGTTTMHEMLVGTDPGRFDATAAQLDFLLAKNL